MSKKLLIIALSSLLLTGFFNETVNATHLVYYTCPQQMQYWVEIDNTTWTYQHTESGVTCYVTGRVEYHHYYCSRCGLNKVVTKKIEVHCSSEGRYTEETVISQ